MTEFLTAHAILDERAAHRSDSTPASSFASHGMADEDVAALAARGNHYRRGVPELPIVVPATARRATGSAPAAALAGHRRLRPLARARVAVHSRRATCSISGDMLLPRISTNVACGRPIRTAIRSAASCDSLARVRGAAPTIRWCCRRTACRFAASPLRVAQLRAHHDARLAELHRRRSRGASTGVGRADGAGAVPARARPRSSGSSRWARRSPISIISGGASRRAPHAGGRCTLALRGLE